MIKIKLDSSSPNKENMGLNNLNNSKQSNNHHSQLTYIVAIGLKQKTDGEFGVDSFSFMYPLYDMHL